jgi:ribosomal protein L22
MTQTPRDEEPEQTPADEAATPAVEPEAAAPSPQPEPEPGAAAASPQATPEPEPEPEPAQPTAEPETAPVSTPQAEATAARQTGVGKGAAEAATRTGSSEPAQPARRPQPTRPAARTDGRVVVRAQAKYVRTSARKARLVADHVRGKSVQEARAILAHTPRAVARDWIKVLDSAVANAEHNHELVGDELKIHAITADEGPTLKRFRPRAMGRATRIRKRTSHLTIQLTPKETR